MPSPWITFVKQWSKDNDVPYSQAIKDKRVSEEYQRLQRQSKDMTQQVTRNVAQGKLMDIAERAKALPPKPPKPPPLPRSSAVKAVFDNPYTRKKIFDFKLTPRQIARRKDEKQFAQQDLAKIGRKAQDTKTAQMLASGMTYQQVFGQSEENVDQYTKFLRVLDMHDNYEKYVEDDEEYLLENDNNPEDERSELRSLVKKLAPKFKRQPTENMIAEMGIDLENVGLETVEYWNDGAEVYDEDGEPLLDEYGDKQYGVLEKFVTYTDEAAREMQEWVDVANELNDELRNYDDERQEAFEGLKTIGDKAKDALEERDLEQENLSIMGQNAKYVKQQRDLEQENLGVEGRNAQYITKIRDKAQESLMDIVSKMRENQREQKDAQRSLRNIARVQIRKEVQEKRDEAQDQLSNLASLAQLQQMAVKKPRPEPVRRGRQSTDTTL
jgi:hypothetical protein